ncbi:MAG TPA: SCO family protein [Polyangiaceae bacterium]|nr:SCO family protein [Polyangiaceae bacterium]
MAKASVRSLAAALVAGLLLTVNPAASAPVPLSERIDRTEPTPKQLRGVDVKERLGSQLPLSLPFRDQDGRSVTLGQYFDGQHPVLFTLNYSNCPMLCSLMLTGLVKGLKNVEWGINREYQVVTVSLDAAEPLDVTQRTANRYLTQYGRPEARPGWHFLTGSEQNIRAYADALGFSYRYDEKRKEFAHPAAIALASPSGTLVRYLYGIEFEPKTLRLGLVEASEGKIGTTLDRLVLYCFHYDSSEGRYAPVAKRIMEIGGALTVALLGGFLWVLSRADSKRRRHLAESTVT